MQIEEMVIDFFDKGTNLDEMNLIDIVLVPKVEKSECV